MKALLIFLALAVPAKAQELVFDIAPVEACIRAGGGETCAGKAADLCVDATPGGYTTVGMGACTGRELSHWDGWLNIVYQQLYAKLAAEDAAFQSHAPKQAEALRDMQRAWIGFRDAKCSYEASQWGGGTGAGPASVSCHLQETARQMLYLQSNQLGD
ncbi:lysozyme inhibitor LprI family protein [Roseovarius sp.]|uniref:lysozyme inhibitor LprI family protein n=1 Tax=Roseovarius sp. TaxID=1486281 RepID=UPI003A987BFD